MKKDACSVLSLHGQVWRSDADDQDYLVTKVDRGVFTQYAMLPPGDHRT
jgi:hypothetical protein